VFVATNHSVPLTQRDIIINILMTVPLNPGSAPGLTLGNEYGKTLPFLPLNHLINDVTLRKCFYCDSRVVYSLLQIVQNYSLYK